MTGRQQEASMDARIDALTEVIDPRTRALIEDNFVRAAFVADVGITLVDCGPGWCESSLLLLPRHLQHTGVVHAGVQTTIADHTAGAAAMTLLAASHTVVTAEFNLSLLRAGRGTTLWCRAQVLKPGRNLTFVESEVYAFNAGKKILISKFSATMAVVLLT